jgi:hypothetical protein
MRLYLRPLGVRQTPAIHEKLLSELESQTSEPGNPKSQQTLEDELALYGFKYGLTTEARRLLVGRLAAATAST